MTDPTALWQLLTNIATVVGAIVVAITAIIAAWQLRESARARMLSAMLSVYDSISDPSARLDRKRVFERDLSVPPAEWDLELYSAAERATLMFVRLGALVKHRLIPQSVFLPTHANLVIRVADELEQFVQYRRRVTGTTFAKDFDWLADVARNWRLTRPDRNAPLIIYSPSSMELRRVNALPRVRARNPLMRLHQWIASLLYPGGPLPLATPDQIQPSASALTMGGEEAD